MISSPSARAGVPDTVAAWSAIAVESTKTVLSRPASGRGAGAGGSLDGVQAGMAMVPPDRAASGDSAGAGVSQLVASGSAAAAGSAGADPSGEGAPQAPGSGSTGAGGSC